MTPMRLLPAADLRLAPAWPGGADPRQGRRRAWVLAVSVLLHALVVAAFLTVARRPDPQTPPSPSYELVFQGADNRAAPTALDQADDAKPKTAQQPDQTPGAEPAPAPTPLAPAPTPEAPPTPTQERPATPAPEAPAPMAPPAADPPAPEPAPMTPTPPTPAPTTPTPEPPAPAPQSALQQAPPQPAPEAAPALAEPSVTPLAPSVPVPLAPDPAPLPPPASVPVAPPRPVAPPSIRIEPPPEPRSTELLVPPVTIPVPLPVPPPPVPRPAPRAQAPPRPRAPPPAPLGTFANPMDLNFSRPPTQLAAPRTTAPRGSVASRSLDLSLGAPRAGPNRQEAFFDARAANVGADWMQGVKAFWLRHRYYPPQAAENGEDGTVEVEMRINRQGRVEAATVKTRSGSVFLDMAAISVWRDAQLPPLPAETPGDRITITISINYLLIRH